MRTSFFTNSDSFGNHCETGHKASVSIARHENVAYQHPYNISGEGRFVFASGAFLNYAGAVRGRAWGLKPECARTTSVKRKEQKCSYMTLRYDSIRPTPPV